MHKVKKRFSEKYRSQHFFSTQIKIIIIDSLICNQTVVLVYAF
uniref:Uncharacterized protein n=1 Tax=Anguilla anguilla TaxID=7936 RepID=A0A0E9XJC9_ANGAN